MTNRFPPLRPIEAALVSSSRPSPESATVATETPVQETADVIAGRARTLFLAHRDLTRSADNLSAKEVHGKIIEIVRQNRDNTLVLSAIRSALANEGATRYWLSLWVPEAA